MTRSLSGLLTSLNGLVMGLVNDAEEGGPGASFLSGEEGVDEITTPPLGDDPSSPTDVSSAEDADNEMDDPVRLSLPTLDNPDFVLLPLLLPLLLLLFSLLLIFKSGLE